MIHHKPGEICDWCEHILEEVIPYMDDFFHWAKKAYSTLHIAEGWRDEVSQNKDFSEGRSEKKWPDSKHNHTENGLPCSLALDLFRLSEDGKANYDINFYADLYKEAIDADFNIRWGGKWHDYDHYEMIIRVEN